MSEEFMVTKRGRYVVLDGLDGAGKTEVFNALRKIFVPLHQQIDTNTSEECFMYTREPGGTPLGEDLRKMVLSGPMDSYTEMCLFLAQRKELRNVIKEYLARGTNVISDRSESATFAYQICGRELFHLEDLFWIMNQALDPFPTLYIFLDLPVEVALSRLNNREGGQKADRFEMEQVDFFNRVKQGFYEFPRKVQTPCVFVDATLPKEEVASEVVRHVRDHVIA